MKHRPAYFDQHTQMHTIRWLLEKLDDIHDALCPGQFGTWQQRAEQAVDAAKRLSATTGVDRGSKCLAANSEDLSEKLKAGQIKADACWMLDQIKARQP